MAISASDRVHRLKRIVTGKNNNGQSIVALEGPPAPTYEPIPGAGLFEIWSDAGGRSFENLPGPAALLPAFGGTKCRWFTVLPVPPGVTPQQLAAYYDSSFKAMTPHDIRPDTTRHPGMHCTETLDFIIVIEGKVRLILDNEERVLLPGDVVVQRATNHAWSCVGDVPALLVAILIDKTLPLEQPCLQRRTPRS